VIAITIEMFAFLTPRTSGVEGLLREAAASTFAQTLFIDIDCRVPIRQEAV
jgi:hypothetical protein